MQDDQLAALKSQNKEVLEILRFAISKIKNAEIEKKAELSDDETVTILKKIVKELHESLEAAESGNRADLAAQSKKQIEILSAYLPAEISDEELMQQIKDIIEKNKAVFEANKKAVIGICMKELRLKADTARIMTALQPFLTQ